MNRTEAVAGFAAGVSAEDVPEELRLKMRVHLVDTLAAGISGAATDAGSKVRAAATAFAPGPSTVWGSGRSADPRSAAVANGSAAHVLELDDTGGCDHSGAVVTPAVIAMQQASNPDASLDDVLVAAALGYEVARRTQFALGGYSSLNDTGWHSTSVCGPIGAAVGAARIAELTREQTADAIGLASSMMSGGWSFKTGGGSNKALHPGLAAGNGVESARLAMHGVRGTRDAFEDIWGGVGRLYADEHANLEALTDALGSRWVAFDASIKAFPSCASAHRMLQLAHQALVPLRLPLDEVTGISIRVSPLVAAMCGEARLGELQSFEQRQLSIPYGVALTLIKGSMAFDALHRSPDASPGIGALLARIRIIADERIPGAHGHGTLTIESAGAAGVYSTDEVGDPREAITTLDAVLTKAEQTLRSVSKEKYLDGLQYVAEAPASAAAGDVFARL